VIPDHRHPGVLRLSGRRRAGRALRRQRHWHRDRRPGRPSGRTTHPRSEAKGFGLPEPWGDE